jgi:cytochrome P450
MVSAAVAHRRPELFKDPYQFDPLRYSLVTTLLFQRFNLELLDPNPGKNFGMGAVRPTPTRVSYHQRTP